MPADGRGRGGGPVVVRARERRVHGEGGQQVRQEGGWNAGRTLVNTGELEQAIDMAERRVLEIQAKLHRWAVDDPHRRFGDLFNLVADPAFLLVAWDRVRGNKGAKTAGMDGHTAASIAARGVEEFLGALRDSLKDRSFCPLPSRERLIPKPGTAKRRRLGISTVRDRVVQASLKLCWNRFSRRISSRAATGSVPAAGSMTRWPRCGTWRPTPMSGSLRVTSGPASTKSRMSPFKTGCARESPTNASWRW